MARILLVEDEPVLRLTFEQFLREAGHNVVACGSYADAITALDEDGFDLVVSDIILGGKTGIDLLRTIHERELGCQVVMITGDPSVDTAAQAVRLGAFDYLPKPVKEHDLLRVTRLALDRAQLARERDRYAAQVQQSRDELVAIFESVGDGIVTVDAALCICHANAAGRANLQLNGPDVAGTHLLNSLLEQFAPVRTAVERTLETGEKSAPARIEVSADAGPRVIEYAVTPLVGDAGAVLVTRDITRLRRLEEELAGTHGYHGIVGRSAPMQQVFDLIEDVKETDSTVLICGESGTGKEEIASVIQRLSGRARGPYVRVNCAALAEDVLESELFGHVKGAFTGAIKDREGRFEAADHGTILLDEIGDVSPKLQLRLLRVLQEREFERVGDTTPIKTDVRVIATTNQDLQAKIESGTFRQDLYYRLNVVRIDVPPLRERGEDIPPLIDHFVRHFNAVMQKDIAGIAPDALEVLMHHPWMGNVRELENCIERAFVVCRDAEIQVRHLPPEIRGARSTAVSTASKASAAIATENPQLSREKVIATLMQTDWNIAKSAKKLGVARNTLYLRMKNLGISRPDTN
jgi:DNA-binding NtrC family response regulator